MSSVKRQLNMDAECLVNGDETPKRSRKRTTSFEGEYVCVCAWLRFGDAMLIRITIQTRSENITLGDWALGTGCQGNYVHCITLLGGYGIGTVLKSKPSMHHRTRTLLSNELCGVGFVPSRVFFSVSWAFHCFGQPPRCICGLHVGYSPSVR